MSSKINWATDYVSFYKIVCKDNEIKFTYVGHTMDFATRKSCHKSACYNINCNGYNCKLYVFMRDHGGFDSWNMIEIHKQLCDDKRHAEQIEQSFIEQEEFTLNSIRAYITEEQRVSQLAKINAKYYLQHREKLVECRLKNVDKKSVYNAEYRKNTKLKKALINVFKSQVLLELLLETKLIE